VKWSLAGARWSGDRATAGFESAPAWFATSWALAPFGPKLLRRISGDPTVLSRTHYLSLFTSDYMHGLRGCEKTQNEDAALPDYRPGTIITGTGTLRMMSIFSGLGASAALRNTASTSLRSL
jgi:hypothetical protein